MLFFKSSASLFLHALTCLKILASVMPSVATPLPLPMALMMANYSPSLATANRSLSDFLSWRDVDLSYSMLSRERRGPGTFTNLLKYYDAASSRANDLKVLASKSASVDNDDLDFQNDCVAALTGFNNNMDGLSTSLIDAASSTSGTSDKGLANYDPTNDLETLLKKLINLNKDTLSEIDILVDNLPVVGPTLGPIVYNLKCIIDNILNLVEDSSDSIINQLQPLLQALLGKAVSTTCRSGVSLLGLCL